MKTAVIGYPRVGALRELKFATEKYFKKSITAEELQDIAGKLRKTHWRAQSDNRIDYISSNDFSFYDNMLDTAVLLNVIPARYRELKLSGLDEYFAMARGYQGEHGDVKALAMKKWFNTNYHYMVPEIEDETVISLTGSKPFDEYEEAKNLGIETKPVIIGIFTFLRLARLTGRKTLADVLPEIVRAYAELLERFACMGVSWVQFDEPELVKDLSPEEVRLFCRLYKQILAAKGQTKVLLQTYFGDIRDCFEAVITADFDGIGLDFMEGRRNLPLIKEKGFPEDKVLFAGLVNGKNIWRNHYLFTLQAVEELKQICSRVVLNTSCSLLHVPYTISGESRLSKEYTKYFAFAREKLKELSELKQLLSGCCSFDDLPYAENEVLFQQIRGGGNQKVQDAVRSLNEDDFVRRPVSAQREALQKERLRLPLLPTTTIGSFPQTPDVKANRAAYKKGERTLAEYTAFNKEKIAECIALQEEIGLDVLVHGEFERNDMVEYFGEQLEGFLFTERGWVQSYGTRCVKPPIVWGDVARQQPMTVEYSVYAQSLTERRVKGMLTGPVTILNWSFPREDISLRDCAMQIALAIRAEVLDLEAGGLSVIQIDEAALREKLPLRKSDWQEEYLEWAIPAFRLVHSGVKPETQIHTHMCYSEFSDIIREIDAMDADVITFEAARSDLEILKILKENGFQTEVGPGIYDIHSPRVPGISELKGVLLQMLDYIPAEKLWVNPDCGLKTRGNDETRRSLEHMAAAAGEVRRVVER